MSTLQIVLAVLVSLVVVDYAGIKFRPRPFAEYLEASQPIESIPLPSGLPAPVERYFRSAYGDSIPVVHSVVITGRGKIRPFGVWLAMRYRFTHDAGKGYRHYIEATWFGFPYFKVNERYLDGKSLMELPWGKDEGPKIEQAANLGMWAELATAAPSVLLTDARVWWEPVDDVTANLVVPLGESETDRFVVRFDAECTRMETLEAMRYRDSKSEEKILWIASSVGERTIGAARTSAVGTATWADQGKPWAIFEAEDIRYNVDVSEYVRARGL